MENSVDFQNPLSDISMKELKKEVKLGLKIMNQNKGPKFKTKTIVVRKKVLRTEPKKVKKEKKDTTPWIRGWDDDSEQYYYYNDETEESSWDVPENFLEEDFEEVESTDEEKEEEYSEYEDVEEDIQYQVGTKWLCLHDDENESDYYLNIYTDESVWEKPADYDEQLKRLTKQPIDKIIDEVSDSESDSDDDDVSSAFLTRYQSSKGGDFKNSTEEGLGRVRNESNEGPILVTINPFVFDDDSTVDFDEVAKESEGMTIEKYAEENFNLKRGGIFKSRVSVDRLLSWKKDVIKTCLLNLAPKLALSGVQIFRNVTGFMGDRVSSKASLEHGHSLCSQLIHAPVDLRDEIFCQIIKQTTRNPSQHSTIKGFELLVIALATFSCSIGLKPHLANFLMKHRNESPSEHIKTYSEYALMALWKIDKLGPRKEVPSPAELQALSRCDGIYIKVFFLDGNYMIIKVDSWTTSAELVKYICRILRIKTIVPFSIFEINFADEERCLEEEERILDCVSYWERSEGDIKRKKGKRANVDHFHFIFKVSLYVDFQLEDMACVELMYMQGVQDILSGRYPIVRNKSSRDDDWAHLLPYITLGALHAQGEIGDAPDIETAKNIIKPTLENYISKDVQAQASLGEVDGEVVEVRDGKEAILSRLCDMWSKLKGYDKTEVRLSYIDVIKAWKVYGSEYFLVTPVEKGFNGSVLPPVGVYMAINSRGILIFDTKTRQELEDKSWADICSWGKTASAIQIVHDRTNRYRVYFKTEQGPEICSLIKRYHTHFINIERERYEKRKAQALRRKERIVRGKNPDASSTEEEEEDENIENFDI